VSVAATKKRLFAAASSSRKSPLTGSNRRPPLSMKEGRVSSLVVLGLGGGFELGSSLYCSLSRLTSWVGAAPVAQFLTGPSCGQGVGGACRSKRLTGGEHVPDRLGLAACDLDRGDLAAAFLAVVGAHPRDDRLVVGVAAGGVGGFDQRPAQVVGSVLAQRAAAVAFTRLLDSRAEAGVADELARAREAPDVADFGGDV
jgi:hypothetical protein